MPKFTVELAYPLHAYATVTVEAEDEADACRRALDRSYDDDQLSFETATEGAGSTFVDNLVRGEHGSCHAVTVRAEDHAPIPPDFDDPAAQLRSERDELRAFVALVAEAAKVEGDVDPRVAALNGLVARARHLIGSTTAERGADFAAGPTAVGWERWGGSTVPHAEGWILSDSCAYGGDVIERLDEAWRERQDGADRPGFATDAEAEAFVRRRAGEGSELHQWALAVHEATVADRANQHPQEDQ